MEFSFNPSCCSNAPKISGGASSAGAPACGPKNVIWASGVNFGSSEEIVGGFGLRELAKRVIEGEFKAAEGAKSVRFPHSDFCLVVQTLNDAAGKQLLRAEIVEDQLTVIAQ